MLCLYVSACRKFSAEKGKRLELFNMAKRVSGSGKIDPHTFSKGSSFPPLEKGAQRLYSMRFCPFAHRARLVLAHKQIQYETVNVHLVEKPDWFLEKNALGQVPTWEKDGAIVSDSLIVAEYLDAVFKKHPLMPSDPLRKAHDFMLINYVGGKLVPNFYKIINEKGEDKNAVEALTSALQWLEDALKERGSRFFGGDKPGFVDLMIWPFQERLPVLDIYAKVVVPMTKFSRLTEWQGLMKETPAVKSCAQTDEMHAEFTALWKNGEPNPYDLGLD